MVKAKRKVISIVIGVIGIMLWGAFSTEAFANTEMYVSPGGDIQTALDTVGNSGGGIVHLNPGTYTISTSLLIPNNTTLKGVATRPVIKMKSGVDEQVIKNKSIPFANVTADFLTIDGGLTSLEQNYPAYYHSGSTEYNDRISSGAETKAQLNAEIAAARLNVIGIDFSDQHTTYTSTNSKVVNCIVQNCSMGINYGRTNGATIKSTTVTNCGAIQKYYHGLYLSTVDNLLVDGLNASNNVTGMGLKICDFYDTVTESSIIVQNCTLNNNYDRGMAIYDMNNVTVYNNTAKGNTKTGINLIGCSNGSMTYNTATGNGYVVNSAYDIWLNGCTSITQNNNTYGTKSGF